MTSTLLTGGDVIDRTGAAPMRASVLVLVVAIASRQSGMKPWLQRSAEPASLPSVRRG